MSTRSISLAAATAVALAITATPATWGRNGRAAANRPAAHHQWADTCVAARASDVDRGTADHGTVTDVVADRIAAVGRAEPTRLLSISYAVFCLKKKKNE